MNDCFFYEKGTGVAHMQAFKVRASEENINAKILILANALMQDLAYAQSEKYF